jgi:hypothetical protein
MHAAVPFAPERAPRRARYLIPRDTPRRTEILAALTVAALLTGLLFVPLTVALAAACHAASKLSRWRPVWLVNPAAGGLVWVLAVGPAAALAGFGAAPAGVTSLLSRAITDPATVDRLALVPAVVGRGLAGEFPLALLLAPALAAIAWWLDRLHTDEWDMAAPRPGLAGLSRRRLTVALVRSGRVVTRDGACLGSEWATGRPVDLAWRETDGGVLVTGASWDAVSASSLQLVHAAIRRRTPVIVVDLAAGSELPAALAALCVNAGARLQVFGPGGPGCYDPFREHDAGTAADLVVGMLDQAEVAQSTRLAARACLAALFTLMSAVPDEPPGSALDGVVSLLRPGACRAAIKRVPGFHPGRPALAESLQAAADWLEADQASGSLIVQQLTALRASPLGRWLVPAPQRPGSPAAGISVSEVMRERAVALFSLDHARHGRAAAMIANLVARDAAAICAGLRRDGAAGDGLAWFGPCDALEPSVLPGTGLVSVLTTTSPEVAGVLADHVGVRVVHRLADPQLAGRLAPLTGARWVPASRAVAMPEGLAAGQAGISPGSVGPGAGRSGMRGAPPFGVIKAPRMPAESFCRLGEDEFALIVGQGERVVERGRAVTGRVGGQPGQHGSSRRWPR